MRHYLALVLSALLIAACGAGPSASAPPSTTNPTAPTTPSGAPYEPPATNLPGPTANASALADLTEYRSDAGRDPAWMSTDQRMKQVVAADTAFAFDLYHVLADGTQSGVFMSPYSISTALSMVLAGARGRTADQLAQALGASDSAAWDPARNLLESSMVEQVPPSMQGQAQPMTLESTNSIFGQSGYPFEQPFLDLLARDYGAGLEAVNFEQQPEDARQAINAWVDQQTKDRIKELLAQGTITELTRAVLVNAIYFKANWIYQFDPKATTNDVFHLLNTSTVTAPTMHLQQPLDYADGDSWSAVSLPYFGASMLIIVPAAGHFASVERSIDPAFIADLDAKLAEYGVTLSVPKWSFDNATDLVPPLESLGISDLFDPNGAADLSGITQAEYLFISGVAHEANITVDEHGTEAAAATAAIATATAGPSSTATLTIDRPFLYLIRDQNTNEVLFMGQVVDPTQADG